MECLLSVRPTHFGVAQSALQKPEPEKNFRIFVLLRPQTHLIDLEASVSIIIFELLAIHVTLWSLESFSRFSLQSHEVVSRSKFSVSGR